MDDDRCGESPPAHRLCSGKLTHTARQGQSWAAQKSWYLRRLIYPGFLPRLNKTVSPSSFSPEIVGEGGRQAG